MNNRTHIHDELKSIAPELINISASMPYTLPPAYFSGLTTEIFLSQKKEIELPELLAGFSKTMPYSVPAGYFEQFPNLLLQKLHTGSLLNEESTFFNEISRTTPYTVPNEYFESFPKVILQKIKEEEQLQAIPTGYFENLSDLMLVKVRKLDTIQELEDVAPLLNTISKQPVQHVPKGYFDNLQPQFVAPLDNAKPVVFIKRTTSWLKYAVAASIILLLSFGAYFLYNSSKTAVPSIANQPSESIINNQLAELDATIIEDYLKTSNAVIQTALPAGGVEELSNGDLNELLQGFTDQQLKKHIEETPELPTTISPKHHN